MDDSGQGLGGNDPSGDEVDGGMSLHSCLGAGGLVSRSGDHAHQKPRAPYRLVLTGDSVGVTGNMQRRFVGFR